MSVRIAQHIRSNVYGLIAVFIALGGTAYAVEANSIKSKHIVNGQVKTADLADLGVTSNKLADNAVGAAKVVDGSLDAADIADTSSLGTAEISETSLFNDNSLTDNDIDQSTFSTTPSGSAAGDLAGSYPAPTIAAGAIVNGDINASAAIAYSKLAGLGPGQAIVGNAGGFPSPTTISGDATLNSSGTLAIAASAIGSAEVSNDSLVSDDIDNNGLRQVDLGSALSAATFNFATVPANSCLVQPNVVPSGMTPGEIAFVLPADGAGPVGLIYETGISIADDTLELNICNVTNSDINPPSEDHRIVSINP